jgi:flagellar protein FlaG
MTKIDSQLATQVGDSYRPAAVAADQQQQATYLRSRDLQTTDSSPSVLSPNAAPTAEQVRTASEQVRKVIEAASGRQLSFGVDDTGKTLLVKIVGSDGEVVSQIPSKEILDLHQRIHALVGAFFDKKA